MLAPTIRAEMQAQHSGPPRAGGVKTWSSACLEQPFGEALVVRVCCVTDRLIMLGGRGGLLECEEITLVELIRAHEHAKALTAGQDTLGSFMAHARCAVVIANDSGSMHIMKCRWDACCGALRANRSTSNVLPVLSLLRCCTRSSLFPVFPHHMPLYRPSLCMSSRSTTSIERCWISSGKAGEYGVTSCVRTDPGRQAECHR